MEPGIGLLLSLAKKLGTADTFLGISKFLLDISTNFGVPACPGFQQESERAANIHHFPPPPHHNRPLRTFLSCISSHEPSLDPFLSE